MGTIGWKQNRTGTLATWRHSMSISKNGREADENLVSMNTIRTIVFFTMSITSKHRINRDYWLIRKVFLSHPTSLEIPRRKKMVNSLISFSLSLSLSASLFSVGYFFHLFLQRAEREKKRESLQFKKMDATEITWWATTVDILLFFLLPSSAVDKKTWISPSTSRRRKGFSCVFLLLFFRLINKRFEMSRWVRRSTLVSVCLCAGRGSFPPPLPFLI